MNHRHQSSIASRPLQVLSVVLVTLLCTTAAQARPGYRHHGHRHHYRPTVVISGFPYRRPYEYSHYQPYGHPPVVVAQPVES